VSSTDLQLAGVVLCGGGSARMGSAKAMIEVGGRPLVMRVAERLSAAADPVFLATGTPGRFGHWGFPEVADQVAGAGPLAGVAAGLEASPHPLVAAVAVDMPFASPEVFRLLATLLGDHDAAVPESSGGLEPLHAVYGRWALPLLREALQDGRLGMRSVLARLRTRVVGPKEWSGADPTGRFALNLNTPADLSLLAPPGPSQP